MVRKIKQETREKQTTKVLDMMREGVSTLKACQAVGIAQSTFATWVSEDKELSDKYARAREDLVEKIANDLMEIADQPPLFDMNGKVDVGSVNKQRLQVDSRKWLLSKLAPKKYGDKLELSGDQDNPIAITKIERVIVKK